MIYTDQLLKRFPKKENPNFRFDDKGGRFAPAASMCEMRTKTYRLEIWSEDGPEGKPAVLKVRMTQLEDDRYNRYTTKGTRDWIKMDYYRVPVQDLYYVIDNLSTMSGGKRLHDKVTGKDVYMVLTHSNKYAYITKEEFDDPNYDFTI